MASSEVPSTPLDLSPLEETPQEILDLIVDLVAACSWESLPNVSLSSRRFLHRSQLHIFHSVRFSGKKKALPRLFAVLVSNPTLFGHVRTLQVFFPVSKTGIAGVALRHMTPHLTGLRTLSLIGHGQFPPNLTKEVKVAFGKLFTSSSPPQLSIIGISNFPAKLVVGLPLKALDIGEGTSLSIKKTDRVEWRLRYLKCDKAAAMMQYVIDSSPMPVQGNLVTLDLTAETFEQHILIWAILNTLSNSTTLKNLTLQYHSWKMTSRPAFTGFKLLKQSGTALPTLPLLQNFRLIFRTVGHEASQFTMQRIGLFLAAYPMTVLIRTRRPSLEAIDISHVAANLGGVAIYQGMLAEFLNFSNGEHIWKFFDTILDNHKLLPKLRALRLRSTYDCAPFPGAPGATQDEEERLRKIRRETFGPQIQALLPTAVGRIPILDVGLSREAEDRFDALSSRYDGAHL
ncbi:hypothetical protein DFP72DRAFT_910452 [Ephemerocybe angulata]|uniref:Uncharacterized protein n=1 Tax=Ephemerocybe angulata TaxID=980116 RepID=A0A8H6HQE8_9AGAR|nr:hypothetical protein DFP72DRAFT_910452 [Tulosesus angulatus]